MPVLERAEVVGQFESTGFGAYRMLKECVGLASPKTMLRQFTTLLSRAERPDTKPGVNKELMATATKKAVAVVALCAVLGVIALVLFAFSSLGQQPSHCLIPVYHRLLPGRL
jgi:hypothetical protein